MLIHYFQECLSRKSAQCLYIYKSLTPCSPKDLFPHASSIFLNLTQETEIHCTQSPTTSLHCIQLEHPSNSVLTKANLNVAFLCTPLPLQVAGLEASECSGLQDNIPTNYLLLYSLQSGLEILSFNSVHLWKPYATFTCFLSVMRNSARIEQPLTAVKSHHWSNLQTINSLCKGLLAEAPSFAGPENQKPHIKIPINLDSRTINTYDRIIWLIILVGFQEKVTY